MRLLAIACALVVGGAVGFWRAQELFKPQPPIELNYVVTVVDPEMGTLEVQLEILGLERSKAHLGFSANAVASSAPVTKFQVREAYGRKGDAVEIERVPGEWTIHGAKEKLRVVYEVNLQAQSSQGQFAQEALSSLDGGGGRLLGNDVFLFPLDAHSSSIEVRYELPDGWQLYHPFPTGEFTGGPPSLYDLYASAVAVGPYRTITRQVGDCELVLALRGRFEFGDDDLMDVIRRIAAHQLEFFGQVPQKRFLFIVDPHPHATDPRRLHYFGLHFRASMILLIDPRTDRVRLQAEPASLCAHEFFHTWLGEQLRQEDYKMNWFVEGVTSLYADRTRLATRMLDKGRHAEELRRRYEDDYASSSLLGQMSVAEAGEQVLQNEGTTRLLYSGGTLLAVALEDEIRLQSRATATLDDVIQSMVAKAVDDPEYILSREHLETELAAIAGSDFGEWLDRYVYGTETPPLPGYVIGR